MHKQADIESTITLTFSRKQTSPMIKRKLSNKNCDLIDNFNQNSDYTNNLE